MAGFTEPHDVVVEFVHRQTPQHCHCRQDNAGVRVRGGAIGNGNSAAAAELCGNTQPGGTRMNHAHATGCFQEGRRVTILAMTVALIDGHAPTRNDLLARCGCTLDQSWAANEAAYTWDDLSGLAERLNFGHFV